MSTLDLDKRKVFSILEQKAKIIEDSSSSKNPRKIKLCLHKDLYKNDIPLLKNEGSLDDILLFIEEQSNRRFVYQVGAEWSVIDNYAKEQFNKDGKLINVSDIDVNDLVYTIIFNQKIEAIDPKSFIDRSELFYITLDEDIFYFNGNPLVLTKTANYYKAFCVLYSLIPDGGEALFADLASTTRKRMSAYKNKEDQEIIKYLQDNLTGAKNGFQRKANIPELLDNGKALFENVRTRGIRFNNNK